MTKSLYETDTVLWSAQQARAIRDAAAARINTPAPIDWENVAEEIESLGRSERSALRSRIGVVIEHLLRLMASPAQVPRRGWIDTILAQRLEIERLLQDSPSLRRELPVLVAEEIPRAQRSVARRLALYNEAPLTALNHLSYTEDQVLGDWFPEAPTQPYDP